MIVILGKGFEMKVVCTDGKFKDIVQDREERCWENTSNHEPVGTQHIELSFTDVNSKTTRN